MQKFLITPKSHNRITGPMMVTTSPRASCPNACPLRKAAGGAEAGGCYAEHGFLGGFIWTKLDRLEPGQRFKAGQIKIYDLAGLLQAIRALPPGTVWRHNQAGDLYSRDQRTIDAESLDQIVAANLGRRGFTYTHYDVLDNLENRRLVQDANARGFTINLSANTAQEAQHLAQLGIAPVTTILPPQRDKRRRRPTDRRVVVCPARTTKGVTCATCKICAKQRRAIIGFPALGSKPLGGDAAKTDGVG